MVVSVGPLGAGSHALTVITEVPGVGRTLLDARVCRVVREEVWGAHLLTLFGPCIGIGGLGRRAVSDTQFRKRVCEVVSGAVHGLLAHSCVVSAVCLIRAHVNALLGHVVSVEGWHRGAFLNADVGGWVPVVQLTDWADGHAPIGQVVGIGARRARFDTGPGFVISEGEDSLIAVVDTDLGLDLSEHVLRLRTHGDTHIGAVVGKLQPRALFHTIPDHRIPEFVIGALLLAGAGELVGVVHGGFGLGADCHTGFALVVLEVVGGVRAVCHAAAGAIVCEVAQWTLEHADPLRPVHKLIGRWDHQALGQASPREVVCKLVSRALSHASPIPVIGVLILLNTALVNTLS